MMNVCSFLQNFTGHNTPINAMALNEDGVLVSGGDNGSLQFWDYESGYCFQKSNTIVQPGKYSVIYLNAILKIYFPSRNRLIGRRSRHLRSIFRSVGKVRSQFIC